MSRFSITMNDGVGLIMFALTHGIGGELICPISPSYRVGDMATAIGPNAQHRIIGSRPGEKMHEAMFSVTEARYVARRGNYYIIAPTRGRWTLSDYCAANCDAQPISSLFEYDSGQNDDWLDVNAIRELVSREFGVRCGSSTTIGEDHVAHARI